MPSDPIDYASLPNAQAPELDYRPQPAELPLVPEETKGIPASPDERLILTPPAQRRLALLMLAILFIAGVVVAGLAHYFLSFFFPAVQVAGFAISVLMTILLAVLLQKNHFYSAAANLRVAPDIRKEAEEQVTFLSCLRWKRIWIVILAVTAWLVIYCRAICTGTMDPRLACRMTLFLGTGLFLFAIFQIWRTSSLRLFLQAAFDWLTYIRRLPNHWQSPCGGQPVRLSLFTAAFLLLCTFMLPLAYFFPLQVSVEARPWFDEGRRLDSFRETFHNEIADEYLFGSQHFAENDLKSLRAQFVRREKRLRRELLNPPAGGERSESTKNSWIRTHRAVSELAEIDERMTSELKAAPTAWIEAGFRALFSAEHFSEVAFQFTAASITSLIVPPVTFLSITAAIAGPGLQKPHEFFEAEGAPSHTHQNTFQAIVEKILNSNDPVECASNFVGTLHCTGDLVWVTDQQLRRHAWLLGPPTTGKTQLLVELIEQQIGKAGKRRDRSLLIVDLKPDPYMFHSARLAAKRAGLPFKFLVNTGKPTYGFNPFLDTVFTRHLTRNQRTELFLKVLGMMYGDDYGRGFYFAMNYLLAYSFFLPEIDSPAMFLHYCLSHPYLYPFDKADMREARHVIASLARIAAFEALNITFKNAPKSVVENSINMGAILDSPGVIYLALSPTLEEMTARTIAKFALYLLLANAVVRPQGSTLPVYVFIDEFQKVVASEDLDTFFQQSASQGLSLILANQNPADLDMRSNLRSSIEGSTNVRICFSAPDFKQRQELSRQSGSVLRYFPSIAPDGKETLHSREVPRISEEEIIAMSATQGLFTLQITNPTSESYSPFRGQMQIVKAEPAMTLEEYNERKQLDWPTVEEYPGSFLPNPHYGNDLLREVSGEVTAPPKPALLSKPNDVETGNQPTDQNSSAQFIERVHELLNRMDNAPAPHGKKGANDK